MPKLLVLLLQYCSDEAEIGNPVPKLSLLHNLCIHVYKMLHLFFMHTTVFSYPRSHLKISSARRHMQDRDQVRERQRYVKMYLHIHVLPLYINY